MLTKNNDLMQVIKKTATTMALLSLVLFASCTRDGVTGNQLTAHGGGIDQATQSTLTGPTLGVRTFQTLYSNMLTGAGVKPPPAVSSSGTQATDAINTAHANLVSLLNVNGGMGYSAPMAFAALQLAFPICQAGVAAGTLNIPTTLNPSTTSNTVALLTAAAQTQLINAMAPQFWGRAPSAAELAVIQTNLATVIANPADTQTTSNGVTTSTKTPVSTHQQLINAEVFVCMSLAAATQATTNAASPM